MSRDIPNDAVVRLRLAKTRNRVMAAIVKPEAVERQPYNREYRSRTSYSDTSLRAVVDGPKRDNKSLALGCATRYAIRSSVWCLED